MDGKKPLFSADAAEEYFSTLLTYYRNTGNDIFKRDNEGRHVSDQIYSAEYQKYLGMQIAMREVLEYFAKFELGDTALRQQETVTNRNEPLTLDELRQMDVEPVWVVYGEDAGMWALVEVCEESIFLTNNLGGRTEYAADVELEDDGITVYRRKPEEGTV